MKTIQHLVLIALAALAGCSQTPRTPTAQFLRVKGEDIIAPDGAKFLIRGTNLGNWLNPEGYMFHFTKTNSASEINRAFCQMVGPDFTADFWRRYLDNYITADDIAYLASTGINSIRLPFHYKLFTDDDYMGYTDSLKGFEIFDRLIGWCRDNGLYVILDMHDAPGGQTGDNIDDSSGYPWLFESEVSQRQFIDIWTKIAQRYRDEPTVLGYDLLNEPIAPYFTNMDSLNTRLEPLYKRAVAAIRTVDPNHIVILGGAQWDSNFKVFKDWTFDDNLMYTCHRYGGGTDAEAIRDFIAFRDRTGRPMYMGETGENTDGWIDSLRHTLEANNIGWHYWPYKKLANTRCWVQISEPEGWEAVVNFVESPRTTFQEIRDARPDQTVARKALESCLENCKFQNCTVNTGYVEALTGV